MEKHYICLGGCKGVSKVPGVCQAPDCAKHNHKLVKCNCRDGLHNGFKNKFSILRVLAVLLVIFAFLIMIPFAMTLYTKIANNVEHKNLPLEEVKISYGEKCKQTNFYNITDKNHHIVSQAKQRFLLSSKISEEYFDSHFEFECGAKAANGDHAIFRSKIGDYSPELHLLKFAGDKSEVYREWAKFDEIGNVLKKETALKKLQSCLSGGPENVRVELRPDILFIYGTSGYTSATIDLETGHCQRGDTRATI